MRKAKIIVLLYIILNSAIAQADWAVVPDLTSSTLWQLVSEKRAEVVSSVGFGNPSELHTKQTVFRIIKAKKSDGDIKWAIKKDDSYRPVMCNETWVDEYTYLGSSCSIPGCILNSTKCLAKVIGNL